MFPLSPHSDKNRFRPQRTGCHKINIIKQNVNARAKQPRKHHKNNKSFLMIHSFLYRNNTNISFFSQRYTVLHYILLVTGKLICRISQKQNAHFSKTPVATLRYTSPLCSTNIRHTMTDLIARPRRLRKSPALRAMFEETTLTLNDLVLPIFC